MSKKFYVYELRDPNGKPFYIGKASGRRNSQHRCAARAGLDFRVYRKIRKLWGQGLDFTEKRVFETDNEAEAFAEEKRLIAFYGRDSLTNTTDGGEGISNPPIEVRKKISESKRNLSPETRKVLSLRMKGNQNAKGRHNHWTDAQRAAQSIRLKGNRNGANRWTEERRKALIERNKGNQYGKGVKHIHPPEQDRAQSERMKGNKYGTGVNHKTEATRRAGERRKGKWFGTEEQREATRKRMMGNQYGRKVKQCDITDTAQLSLGLNDSLPANSA